MGGYYSETYDGQTFVKTQGTCINTTCKPIPNIEVEHDRLHNQLNIPVRTHTIAPCNATQGNATTVTILPEALLRTSSSTIVKVLSTQLPRSAALGVVQMPLLGKPKAEEQTGAYGNALNKVLIALVPGVYLQINKGEVVLLGNKNPHVEKKIESYLHPEWFVYSS